MVSEHKATDDFTRRIQEAIDFVHMDLTARSAFMTVGMKIADERREAKAEGIKEGRDLNKWLIDNNRSEELMNSVNDDELYNRLLEEYKLAMKQ